jgi:hypothetical protein
MGGGLMQLVAYGAQDIYLTGNPQITFFKVVYRRHTNFSMETIEQTINGSSTLSASTSTGTVTISRNGDLVSKIYVTSSTAGIYDGSKIVNEVEIEIGGQRIDKHYEEWNDIWNDLTIPGDKHVAFAAMTNAGHKGMSTGANGAGFVQIPLNFWFCRNPGLALPLIALQYHEVKLKFKFGTSGNVGDSSSLGGSAVTAALKVWADYIYLDTDERRRFAQVSHEYLIEQVQKQSATATTSTKLNFNHPVKEIIWTSSNINSYTDAKLSLNGHDRFSAQEEEYFQLRQPYENHTNIPAMNLPDHLHKVGTWSTNAMATDHIRHSWNSAYLKVGVVYDTNISTTEAACDGAANGFSLSDSDGTTPTETKSVILQKEIVLSTAVSDNFGVGKHVLVALVDASVSLVPKVTNTHIASIASGGVMTFEDAIIAAAAVSAVGDALSIIRLSETSSDFDSNIAECLAVRVGIAFDTDLSTTEAACDSTANGFCACSSDGSAAASASTDGKQVIVGDDIAGINVGDVHYLQHIDGSVIVDDAASLEHGMYGQNHLTRAVVQSYSGGLLKYDVQVTGKVATSVVDGFAIWASRTEHSNVSSLAKKINVYSFALKPEEHQPSGTCNFSRIDSAKLETGSALTATDNIYAVNYNVLRIMSGMGGLAYSN